MNNYINMVQTARAKIKRIYTPAPEPTGARVKRVVIDAVFTVLFVVAALVAGWIVLCFDPYGVL